MQWTNNSHRWGLVTQLLHWSLALLILMLAIAGLYMVQLPLGMEKFQLYKQHKTMGLVVLVLVLLRIAWRLSARQTPALPQNLHTWERVLAHATHWLLYALMLTIPLSGYVMHSASGFPLSILGVDVPSLIPTSEVVEDGAKAVHWGSLIGLAGLLVLHIGAALKHHFLLGDDVLRRMVPWTKTRS